MLSSVEIAVGLGTLAALSACAPSRPVAAESPDHTEAANTAASAVSTPAAAAPSATAPAEAKLTTHVALLEPELLEALEGRGFGLGALLWSSAARTTKELDALPGFHSILDVLRADLRWTQQRHPQARVTSMDGFRLFDQRWLSSNEMHFELTGVFNRLDRRAFYDGTCGELRFLYRLAYDTTHGGAEMHGRLPLTVNVVWLVEDDDCSAVAQAWRAPEELSGAPLLEWYQKAGPLAQRASWSLKSVETNLQSLRLQSTVHPTMGGHIEYLMRVFAPNDESLTSFDPAPMENMPDVERLNKERGLKQELKALLEQPQTLAAIDRGTLKLPDRFLATRALSVAPRGLSRKANRPFAQLFEAGDFASLALGGHSTIRSPEALLRRLDGASCVGCHQSRALAGFHHIGNDPSDTPAYDSLLSGLSRHLQTDLERRKAYTETVAAGGEPDEFRPLPERQGVGNAFGAPCGLGDPGFSDWQCAAGLSCQAFEDPLVGVCFPETGIGTPCEYGRMLDRPRPHRDYVTGLTQRKCVEQQVCDGNIAGFALGACSVACKHGADGYACADFLDIDGFQNCLRAKQSRQECAQQMVMRRGMKACDAQTPCRQDFVCVRTGDADVGACEPPYFVFQLRLDGYPLPR